MTSAVVIKVNDLELCNHFYREILQLGTPELISSFGCFYRTGIDSGLYLIKTTASFLEHASSATSWCFSTTDMEGLEKRLKKAGFPLLKEVIHLGCDECKRGMDPEGNQFFVMEKNKNE